MIRILVPALAVLLSLSACNSKPGTGTAGDKACSKQLSDPKATTQAKELYQFIGSLGGEHTMLGHQDALAYGQTWWADEFRSDVNDISGTHPAIFGWDLGHMGDQRNIDSVSFENMKNWAIKAHSKGGINTYSWHMRNYAIGGTSWDKDNCVSECLPGGSVHELYRERLEQAAGFFASLKDKNGDLIPVLFRPFHEMGGHWFWWGEGNCSTEEYKEIFQYTVDFYRKEKDMHQMIIVYSPDKFSDAADYMKYYPGDDYVDIMAFDDYGLQKKAGIAKAVERLGILDSLSTAHNKPMAISETGQRGATDPNWYTEVILPALETNESTGKAAWILFWRNGKPTEKEQWGPSPEGASADDFKKFMEHPRMLGLSDLSYEHKQGEGHDSDATAGCGGCPQAKDSGCGSEEQHEEGHEEHGEQSEHHN